jgi:hypothetical protein
MYFRVPKAAYTRMKELLRTVENGLSIDTNAVASRLTLRKDRAGSKFAYGCVVRRLQ